MDGLEFVTATPPVSLDPARADVACFVGFVARRPVRAREAGESAADYLRVLPEPVRDWLRHNGWEPGQHGHSVEELVQLNDVPLPIETWETFDALFAWNARPIDDTGAAPLCDTALGAAVRSYFAHGGRLCYVVRIGEPWSVRAPIAERRAHEMDLLPTFPPASPVDRQSWRGVGHLFGLPGVSYLCLPDLPDVYCVSPPVREPFTPPDGPEMFIECAARVGPLEQRLLRGVPAPRCDENGFQAWSKFIRRLGKFIEDPAHRLREIQIVAAVPLPIDTQAV
ncbi:MAG: phage tail protein, partial [Opitutaceae bacterium]